MIFEIPFKEYRLPFIKLDHQQSKRSTAMKISETWKSLAFAGLLFSLLFLLLTSTSCSTENISADMEEAPFVLPKFIPGDDEGGDCSGEIAYYPTLTQVSPADFPGYDLAFLVSGGPADLPETCECAQTIICMELVLNYPDILEVGIASSFDKYNSLEIVYENPYGFKEKFREPKGLNKRPEIYQPVNPQPFSLCVENENWNLILFDFLGGIPTGMNPAAVVNTAGGICIVDNIDNPEG